MDERIKTTIPKEGEYIELGLNMPKPQVVRDAQTTKNEITKQETKQIKISK